MSAVNAWAFKRPCCRSPVRWARSRTEVGSKFFPLPNEYFAGRVPSQKLWHSVRQPHCTGADKWLAFRTHASIGFSTPLISGGDVWGMWTVLLLAAAGGFWSENHILGKRLSGPLVATLIGLLASNCGLIPSYSPVYNTVNKFILPFAIPMLLFGADLQRVIADTGKLLLAFLIGSVSTTIGTVVAFWLVPMKALGPDNWKIAAALMGRHIGGAVNYVAVSDALQASSSVVTAGMASDNLICAIYFATLFALAADVAPDADSSPAHVSDLPSSIPPSPLSLSTVAATSALICFGSTRLAGMLNLPGGSLPIITAVTVLLATAFPGPIGGLAKSGEMIAAVLMQVFFATVGASGSVSSVLQTAPSLFLFSLLQITVHLALILAAGRLLGFEKREILLASNANVGGPTTGAGMANAKGWKSLVVPTVLVGIFGYAIATFLSIAFGFAVLRKM